ncbi:MAG TPA: hypothetical protein PL151_00145 [Phycisphaerae bacterium]|nr:hypothetical protein [Phycisphaerae bacterium]HOJ75405.1 hypothetical protein [Phycisphaerae bacterium]HOM52645.1 hypothetical protein [Phycisphaerae bacterium]HON67594.1 hypothetical protein [Phycisphaerae bacterium]HOQ85950.1 hypothetical protein [Phycisphaerae bacterium]
MRRCGTACIKELHVLGLERQCRGEYIGTLVNAYFQWGGQARGVKARQAYTHVGTLHGYREAIRLLSSMVSSEAGPAPATIGRVDR